MNGHLEIVQMFIEKSAELNIGLNDRDGRGWNAFLMACRNKQSEIVKLLDPKWDGTL